MVSPRELVHVIDVTPIFVHAYDIGLTLIEHVPRNGGDCLCAGKRRIGEPGRIHDPCGAVVRARTDIRYQVQRVGDADGGGVGFERLEVPAYLRSGDVVAVRAVMDPETEQGMKAGENCQGPNSGGVKAPLRFGIRKISSERKDVGHGDDRHQHGDEAGNDIEAVVNHPIGVGDRQHQGCSHEERKHQPLAT